MHTCGKMASPNFPGTFAVAAQPISGVAALPVQLALGLRSLVLVDDQEAEMRRRFAYALRAAMAQKGWKAPDLARAINRDASTVSRWEQEKNVPNIFMLKQLAAALGVKPEFLYDPPAVPDYPISEYLVREATEDAVAEGAQRARRPRAQQAG